jgi:hypothetical protein
MWFCLMYTSPPISCLDYHNFALAELCQKSHVVGLAHNPTQLSKIEFACCYLKLHS